MRKERYGNNKPEPRVAKSVWSMVKECFEDLILQILIVATVVSLITGYIQDGALGLVDGCSILVAIVVIVSVTVGNNLVKEKQFQELSAKSDKADAIVTRDGELITIDANDLVVGDIITLELGKCIPADCVLISSANLSCNESSMTGEPDARKKVELTDDNYNHMPCPFVLKSSLIETGNGKAIVLAVGPLT
jgi:magnesium-transporting ATPase (P-type)